MLAQNDLRRSSAKSNGAPGWPTALPGARTRKAVRYILTNVELLVQIR
jgi:hypothetical protein